MAKNTYNCPCGKSFQRSTDAVCTGLKLDGYGESHECWGCPFAEELKKWDPQSNEMVCDHYQCRAYKGDICYAPDADFSCKNTNSGYIHTLDRPMILEAIKWYLSLEGNGITHEVSGSDVEIERFFLGCSLANGKRSYAFPWKSNKTGLRDKKIFFERYFNADGSVKSDLTPEDWRKRTLDYISSCRVAAGGKPLASGNAQCPHYRGIDRSQYGRGYQICCEQWVGPGTAYELKRDAQDNADHRCLCAEQYQSCRFFKQAQEKEGAEKMMIEYPQPGEGMCPCYGGARAKKGGGHLIQCGKWESPLPDDGSYLQRIKMCGGDGMENCRFYLLWWLRENGHREEADGKSDSELLNIYRGYKMKETLAAEKTEAAQPSAELQPADSVLPDKPETRRSPEELAVAISFYKAQTVQNVIEIGRCLIEAKAQLDHGQWLNWLETKAEISRFQAAKFMQIAKEYGSNVRSISHLNCTKALALLAVPADEREEFIEATHAVAGQEKTVDEMSVRELKKVIKERDEARQTAAARDEANGLLRADLDAARQKIADRAKENSRLQVELDKANRTIADKEKALRELESRPVDVAVTEPTEEQLDEMRAEIRRELENEIPQNMYLSAKAAERAIDVFNSAVDAALGHFIEVEQTRPYLQASKDMEAAITWLEIKIERLTELREAMMHAERRRDEHADDIDF